MKNWLKKECKLAEEEGRVVYDKNGKKYIIIEGSIDGAWNKRPSSKQGGYSSLTGHVTIIGARTGKVIAAGMRKLYCKGCRPFLKNGIVDISDPLYDPEHSCNRNHESSPGSMEPELVLELLEELLKQGIIVDTLIADGDASVMALLAEKNLYKEFDIKIKKINCYLHCTRNYANKIRSAASSCPILKHISNFSENLRNSMRTIISNWNDKLESGVDLATCIRGLEEEMANAPNHHLKNHKNCGDFCVKKNDPNEHPYDVSQSVLDAIEFHTLSLVSKAPSLILKKSTNSNEIFNSVQMKHAGDKRLHYGNSSSCETRLVEVNSKETTRF